MDGLQQVTKMYEENERQLDLFLANKSNNVAEGSGSASRDDSKNCVVNDHGQFIATSNTYRQRAAAATQ